VTLLERPLQLLRRASEQGQLVWILFAVVAVQATTGSEFFLTSRNLSNLAGQTVPLALAALGQMAAILVGAIDLSVGMTARLAALLTAGLIDDQPARVLPVVVLVLLVSAGIGAFNGFAVVRLRFHPLLATLITYTVLQGVALVYTQGPVGGIPSEVTRYVHTGVLGITYPVWFLILMIAVFAVMLGWTRFGRSAYAVGGDADVARRAGIDAGSVRFRMMMLCSVMAGLAGIMLVLRQGIGDPRVAGGLELNSIVAVVIGGVSIFGGRGNLVGVLGGIVFLSIMRNSMNLQGIDPLLQGVVTGVLVIVAVALFTRRQT
jgi:ribose/xylose/arabinose/galactoside ABC-type transport system permease subunit